MTPETMLEIVAQAEHASTADRDFVRDFLGAVDAALSPDRPTDVSALVSTEAALGAVDRVLPGWRITLDRSSRWRCTLRESTSRDDDELLGIAVAMTPAIALLAAAIAVSVRRDCGCR
jgi:hypothetical protein